MAYLQLANIICMTIASYVAKFLATINTEFIRICSKYGFDYMNLCY